MDTTGGGNLFVHNNGSNIEISVSFSYNNCESNKDFLGFVLNSKLLIYMVFTLFNVFSSFVFRTIYILILKVSNWIFIQ